MKDHIPDVTKMLDETPCKATPREELRNQIMSSIIPKNEREWWAKRTIEQIERELNAANDRIKQWHAALTPLMPSDFKCWHENNPNEWPEVAAWVITSQRERIKRLEYALKDLLIAVTFADPPKEFNGVLCNDALVPIGFVDSARAALESKEAKP